MSLDHTSPVVKPQTISRDAFLGGRLQLVQPAAGFRAGLESVLLGAAVSRNEGEVLDLGAGVGTAALVALAYHAGLSACLAESDPQVLPLTRDNLSANGLAARARVIDLDVTRSGRERVAAGLQPDHFETVIANPPFFDAGRGTGAAAARAAARHMAPDALDLWVKTAASHAAPGGEVIFIYPAAGLPALLHAFTERFGAVTVLPLAPRVREKATRILVRGTKGSREPFRLLATRALHLDEGRDFVPDIAAILMGENRLHW